MRLLVAWGSSQRSQAVNFFCTMHLCVYFSPSVWLSGWWPVSVQRSSLMMSQLLEVQRSHSDLTGNLVDRHSLQLSRAHTHTQTNQSEVIRRDRGARLRPGGRNTVSRVWTSSTPGLKIDFENLIKTDFMFDFNVGAYISKIHGGMLQNYKCAAPF